jgi:hypothetical protein
MIAISEDQSNLTPHHCQCTWGRLQFQRLASVHHNHFHTEQALVRLRLVWERHIVVSVRQIDYSAVVLYLPLWQLLGLSLRLRILELELKLQESEHHHMESESHRVISLVWVRRRMVQGLMRLVPPLPRLEFESQKEPRSHTLVCESQLQRHRSHLRRDLARMVYGHRIAT